MTITQKCKVSWCDRTHPEVYQSQGYCSYHYRVKNEGHNPEEYKIRYKAKPGEGLAFIKDAVDSDTNECIIWKYGKDSRGYGQSNYGNRRIKAHRLALMLATDEDPPSDVFACHTCDTPLCINPSHLYWGNAKTNFDDQGIGRVGKRTKYEH